MYKKPKHLFVKNLYFGFFQYIYIYIYIYADICVYLLFKTVRL